MIWNIAKKDFLLNLVSARFIVGCILCLIIIPFAVIVNLEDYKKEMEVYNIEVATAKKELESTRVYSGLRPVIVRPPNPLSVFCTGISGNLGNKVKIDFGNISSLPDGNTTGTDNPFLNSFLSIDFTGIISILISLLALIFSYDLFTREREDGTMKLIFSTGTGRSKFLSGKILGLFITLMPVLLLCFLLSIFIILISPNISLNPDQWINVLLIFFFALLYMAVFIMTGAFISSKVRHSSSSIIISLLCWIWFVFLSPVLASHIASGLVSVEKHDNVAYAVEELDSEFREKQNKMVINILEELNLDGLYLGNTTMGDDGYFETSGTAREYMECERRLKEGSEPVRIDYADKKWIIVKDRLDDLYRQKRLQRKLMLLSPTGIFEMVAEGLSRNDEVAIEDFMEDIREYREVLIHHFESNSWFGDFRYITPQPLEEILPIKENDLIAESGQIPDSWYYNNCSPLDLEGVPMFSYREAATPELLQQNLLLILLLFFISSVLYLFITRSFRNYDIR